MTDSGTSTAPTALPAVDLQQYNKNIEEIVVKREEKKSLRFSTILNRSLLRRQPGVKPSSQGNR